MPELPDLQVFSRNLTKIFKGKTVKTVNVPNAKKLNVPVNELKKNLEGQELKNIQRVGKELHFEFENGVVLGMHLMLKGKLYAFEGRNTQRYTIIEMVFNDDKGLAMTDFQGQATPTLNPAPSEAVDALSPELDFRFLKEALSSKKTTIKNFLLDQHIIRGIGNAYADEILWEAGISPLSVCNKIPDNKVKVLAGTISKVLQEAEKSILKSHPDIINGEVRDFLKIHNAKRSESPNGSPILHEVVNSRKTYYTEEQELFK